MKFAPSNAFFKTIAVFVAVLCIISLSNVFQTEPLFEVFNPISEGESSNSASSLSALCEKMFYSRDTTFEALLRQELDTITMCCCVVSIVFLLFLILLVSLKEKYIHPTKTLRMLI